MYGQMAHGSTIELPYPRDGAARLLIRGEESPAAGGGEFETLDPSTGAPLARVAAGAAADIDAAIDAAAAAVAGGWGATQPLERGRLLAAAAAALRSRREEFATLDALDGGLPLWMGRADVDNAVRYFEFFAGAADKVYGETIPLGPGTLDFTVREPYGVCGVITPFNVPVQMVARSIAPALAAGNSVVVKPAEQAPLPALALGRLLTECGFPAGSVNMVAGDGPDAGAHLAGHPRLDRLTFTGSLATGKLVAVAAVAEMTPVTIEAGGKSPQVVFADAPIAAAVAAIAGSALRTAGQVCSAGTRVLIEDAAYDRVAAALAETASGLRLGRAIADPEVGPLVSGLQRDRVLAALDAAGADGVEAIAGGGAPDQAELAGGFFVEPTVFGEVGRGAAIVRDEIFGPVISLQRFGNAAEALELANDSEFGLVAGVWSADVGAALEFSREVKAGQVFVNNYGVGGGVELPFGGFKKSGIGREKGLAALAEYTQLKNVCVKTSPG
jgi:acyl-CoA reductase-like NAD-dependent aldehyde dehydrogenase